MRVLACTYVAVVVVVVAGVQAQTRRNISLPGGLSYMKDIIHHIMSESCQDKEEQCRRNVWPCIDENTNEIQTEEQLAALKACGRELGITADAFYSMTLEDFLDPARESPAFNPPKFGVPENKISATMMCHLKKDGRLALLTACITGSS